MPVPIQLLFKNYEKVVDKNIISCYNGFVIEGKEIKSLNKNEKIKNGGNYYGKKNYKKRKLRFRN